MQKYNLEVENYLGITFFNFKSGNNQPGKIAKKNFKWIVHFHSDGFP